MLGGILVMGSLGIAVGVGLALASKIFYVWVDPKVEAIDEALPGANCGGCGLPGCSANAVAIAEGKASASSCVAGGPEIAGEIAEIMGVKLEAREPDIARPGCTYGVQDADLKYMYNGVQDCRAAALLSGGTKVCPVGCLGLGTCVRACPFDALSMGPDNLPVVDPLKCTGCGTCERICPKHIITLSSYTRRIQHEYTLDECSAPCQRTCPAGIDIPSYIREISNGNYLEAVRVIKETNPFPLVCGRICIAPCEYECRRNLLDEPVAINNLKRFVADYEMNSGKRVHNPRAPETGKRVAVIGGGAEGLTAAYLLNRLGHDTNVYESTSELGGLLRKGLPENRLPRDILDWEIGGIMHAGVQVSMNKRLGKDFSIASLLRDGFNAVFVATGGWDAQLSERAETKGSLNTLPGVQLLIDFILNHQEGLTPATGQNVMILGGGKAALKAALVCKNDGAEDVCIVLRSGLDSASFTEEEVKDGQDQGIQFFFNAALTAMTGEGDRLTNVEITYLSDSENTDPKKDTIRTDTLITGTGRFPELIYTPRQDQGDDEKELDSSGLIRWETITPYAGPSAEDDTGIFRPGEENSDYKAVVEAIGSGRRAASSIQHYFSQEPVETPENMIRKQTKVLNLDSLESLSQVFRVAMPESSPEKRYNEPSLEISKGYSESQAIQEAKRCLQCGLICYRRIKEEKLH